MKQQPVENPWERLRMGADEQAQNGDRRTRHSFPPPPTGDGADQFWQAAAALLSGISYAVDLATRYVEAQIACSDDRGQNARTERRGANGDAPGPVHPHDGLRENRVEEVTIVEDIRMER